MSPRRIGPYILESPLGRGAMGEVYRARHGPLNRVVALKLLLTTGIDRHFLEQRFQLEMNLMAQLDHPNVVRIYDGEVHPDGAYIAMELLDGESLESYQKREKRMPWDQAMALASYLLDALDSIHARGVLHRDIKPSNVQLTADRRVKLLDFGLAKSVLATSITTAGAAVGTLAYLAPEMLHEEGAFSPASDLWATGVTVYRLISGIHPISLECASSDLGEFAERLLSDPIQDPALRCPDLPPSMGKIVMRMLDRDPARRPTNLLELSRRIQQELLDIRGAERGAILRGEVVEPLKPVPERRTEVVPQAELTKAPVGKLTGNAGDPRETRRRRLAFMLGASLAASFVLGVMLARSRVDEGPSPPPSPVTEVTSGPAGIEEARWTDVSPLHEEQLPRLRQEGETGSQAIARLRKTPGVLDLGPTPAPWVHWVALERWLGKEGKAGAPPEPARIGDTGMNILMEREFLEVLHGARDRLDAEIAAAAIRFVTFLPEEPRGWFALGRVLELDHRPAAARKAYTWALTVRGGKAVDLGRRFMWAGLARALDLCEGYDLEADWTRAVGAHGSSPSLWQGLADALLPREAARYRRILESAAALPVPPAGAVIELGEYKRKSLRDWRGAEATWSEALARAPDLERLAEHRVGHYLERGRLDEAREAAQRFPGGDWVAAAVPYWKSRRGEHVWTVADTADSDLLPMRIASRVEDDDAAGALALIEAVRWKGLGSSLELRCALELRRLGQDSPKVRQICEEELLDPEFDLDDWGNAAGTWSHPAGVTIMEGYLSELEKMVGGRWRAPFLRALWYSRQGIDARALDLLEAIDSELPMEEDSQCRMMYLEILGRPLWKSFRGFPVEPGVLDRSREFRAGSTRAQDGTLEYEAALRQGDFGQVFTISADMVEVHPGQMLWILSALWYVSRTEDARSLDSWKERARVIARTNSSGTWALREIEAVEPGLPAWQDDAGPPGVRR